MNRLSIKAKVLIATALLLLTAGIFQTSPYIIANGWSRLFTSSPSRESYVESTGVPENEAALVSAVKAEQAALIQAAKTEIEILKKDPRSFRADNGTWWIKILPSRDNQDDLFIPFVRFDNLGINEAGGSFVMTILNQYVTPKTFDGTTYIDRVYHDVEIRCQDRTAGTLGLRAINTVGQTVQDFKVSAVERMPYQQSYPERDFAKMFCG